MRTLAVSIVVIIIDQLSKFYVKGISIPSLNINHKGLNYGENISVFQDYFGFTFVENPGIAFGLYFGPAFKLLIPLFTFFIVGLLIYMLIAHRKKDRITRLSLALLFGGAIGNLIDRTFYGAFYDYAPLFYGKVVDFINIKFNNYSGNYIFNIADLALLFGLVLFISVFNTKKKKVKESDEFMVPQLIDNKELT